jgi:hypothetical protein
MGQNAFGGRPAEPDATDYYQTFDGRSNNKARCLAEGRAEHGRSLEAFYQQPFKSLRLKRGAEIEAWTRHGPGCG